MAEAGLDAKEFLEAVRTRSYLDFMAADLWCGPLPIPILPARVRDPELSADITNAPA